MHNAPKTPQAQQTIEWYQQTTKNNEAYRRQCFAYLYSALFSHPTPQHIQYISEEARSLIIGRDAYYVSDLMHSDRHDMVSADLDYWQKNCTPSCFRALLICGSAHPNGYLREQCLKLLANEQYVLQYILLRMNDWVPTVRRTAWIIIQEQLGKMRSSDELIQAMPFVEYVRRGKRVQRDEAFSMDALDEILMPIFAENASEILHSPVSLRRLCYRVFLLHPAAQYRDLLLYFIRNESDGAQRSALVRFYLNCAANPISADTVDVFAQDPYWRVRLDAYEYRIKKQGIWDEFEALLMSKSYPIREFAAYYLEKNGFDVVGYCRKHLPDTLLALGDCGTAEDIPSIRSYMETYPCEVLISLVRIGAEDSKELVLSAMQSSNPKITKAAYRLAETRVHFTRSELLPEIHKETDPQRRWRLIRLLKENVGFELLPILIRLLREYTHIQSNILALIERVTYFHAFGHNAIIVSPELHDEITAALCSEAGTILSERLKDHILNSMYIMN